MLARWDEHARSRGSGSRWGALYIVFICGLILFPVLVSMSASLVMLVLPPGAGARAVVGTLLMLLPMGHLVGGVLGRIQGPAVRRSALAWVIAWGPGSRLAAFAPPVVKMCALAGLVGVLGGVGAVMALGDGRAVGVVLSGGIVAMAAMTGIVGVCASLLGQLGSPAVTGLLLLVTGTPALVYAVVGATVSQGSVGGFLGAGILASVIAIICSLWWSSCRLEATSPNRLVVHCARWDQARAFAWTLDAEGARYLYLEPPPRLARIVYAGRPGAAAGLWGAMIRRAVLGWRRRPGRLLLGFGVHTGGLTLLAHSLLGLAPVGWILPAVLLAHMGLPSLMPGLKQALACVSGVRVFGVPDSTLVASTFLPGLLAAGASGAVALGLQGGAALSHLGALIAAAGAVILASLGSHLAVGLRGAMPASLYTPIPTGLGDPSVLLRLAWPFEGVLLMGSIGYAATILPAGPALMAGTVGAIFLALHRWRRRG